MKFTDKVSLLIKKIKRRCRKKSKPLNDVYITVNSIHKFSASGGDILPGPIVVPTSDVMEWAVYTDRDNGKQYISTRIKTKFFFIIPFTYDEYIIEFSKIKYPSESMTSREACQEIYDAEHWNWHEDAHCIDYDGEVHLTIPGPDGWGDAYNMDDYSYIQWD